MADINDSKDTSTQSNWILFRYFIVVLLLFVVVVGIGFCIIKIAFVEKTEWQKIADKERKKIPDRIIYPNRGNIYAADGRLMATSFPLYSVYMDFRGKAIDSLAFNQIPKVAKNVEPDSAALAEAKKNGVDSLAYYIAGKFNRSESVVKKELKEAFRKKDRRYKVYDSRISHPDLKEMEKFPFIRLGRNKSGFFAENFIKRQQPFASLASRTIGGVYASLDSSGYTQGEYGLELQYDSLLRGEPGLKATRRVAGAWQDVPIKKAVNGMDIRTTIDINIQDVVEKALRRELMRTEARSGSVVVMDVKTGEVKAITNMVRTVSGGYREAMNHAVADLMEPGSTFKTASIMVALEDGKCTPNDLVDTGNGRFPYGGVVITDHNQNHGGYGLITVEEAMWNSSNIGVAKTIIKGYGKTPEKYVDGLYRLGLGEDLHLEIPGAGRSIIRRPTEKNWYPAALAWMSFGYETQIPPIYTLAFYNAIANNGKMMRPHFVKEITSNGKVVQRFQPEVVRDQICSDKTLKIIQGMLIGVVENGTGRPAYSSVVRIAGKTGTAQIAEGGTYRGGGHQVSFAGYFPADEPEFSCIAVIRRPARGYPSGGSMSGSVVKEVAEGIFAAREQIVARKMDTDSMAVMMPTPKAGERQALEQVLNKLDIDIDKNNTKSPWIMASASIDQVKFNDLNLHEGLVPRVTGMGAKDAVYLLESAGLQVKMSGVGRVISQSIPAGQKAVRGQTITITLK
ncbi:penicillin-binding protein [Bacteroidia bacterium]|nr:penicillin-binding protein [Bacteroidia bacterium]